jgi:hypothetical protein
MVRPAQWLAVRRAIPLLAVALLAGCGGSGHRPATTTRFSGPVDVSNAGARTVGAGTARFTLRIRGTVGSLGTWADERGSIAFVRSRAHIYKLLATGGIPEELMVDGPYVYANGDVQAAMNDTRVKPWTRLDTRRLTASQRRSNGDELAHVRAPAYLIEGVGRATRVGATAALVHVRGVVDPARLAVRLPASVRSSIMGAVKADFTAQPFPADFWLDAKGRVRRVHVSYRTGSSGRIVVTATYSGFGSPVPLGLPPASHVQDISP